MPTKKMMKSVQFNTWSWLQWLCDAYQHFSPSILSISYNHVESDDGKIKETHRKYEEMNEIEWKAYQILNVY